MERERNGPRILVVTPEITYLPRGMGNMANRLRAKAGGLADVSASLVSALFELGADVHVALPHYRRMFSVDIGGFISDQLRLYKSKLPDARIHLAEDRVFYYRDTVYGDYTHENPHIALAFQREVINNIVPRVQPDLIHANDWMTGLIPAMARRMDIPCLFTIHNIHTLKLTLAEIEESGIDAAEFWKYLFFTAFPGTYEETRGSIPVDLLASGIFAAHFINTVSPTFLDEVVEGRHPFIPEHIRAELAEKKEAGCASGILNAPDAVYNPRSDPYLAVGYSPEEQAQAKRWNKLDLQEKLGLQRDPVGPLLYWPSRLDPVQKGPQLLTDILYDVVSRYWDLNLQLVVVANGPYQNVFHEIVAHHDLRHRVSVCDFDEKLSHFAYAASDFLVMPSSFEPCGLPQMIGCTYGSLPIVHDTGGLHDTIAPLDVEGDTGNGFVFQVWDSGGLSWAIDRAIEFWRRPEEEKNRQIARVMREGAERFNHSVTARHYFDIYERMLERPIVDPF